MIRTLSLSLALLLTTAVSSSGWEEIAHYVSLPIIDGAGLYSSIYSLQKSDQAYTKASAIGVISTIAGTSVAGSLALFGPEQSRPVFRKIHRIAGFVTTAAALSLSIAASIDENINGHAAQYASYGYTGLTCVPLILFRF